MVTAAKQRIGNGECGLRHMISTHAIDNDAKQGVFVKDVEKNQKLSGLCAIGVQRKRTRLGDNITQTSGAYRHA